MSPAVLTKAQLVEAAAFARPPHPGQVRPIFTGSRPF